MTKSRGNRLSFAWMLVFYRKHGRFPYSPSEIRPNTVDKVAEQLKKIAVPKGELFDKAVRTWERHRAEIRKISNRRESTNADAVMLTQWLQESAVIVNHDPAHLTSLLEEHCHKLLIEPPSAERLDRIVRTVISTHDEHLCSQTYSRLEPAVINRLDLLLQPEGKNAVEPNNEQLPARLLRLLCMSTVS